MLSVKGSKLDFAGENVITFILHIKKKKQNLEHGDVEV